MDECCFGYSFCIFFYGMFFGMKKERDNVGIIYSMLWLMMTLGLIVCNVK